MPEEIEIRRLTADDAHAFFSLRLEALERDPLAFTESAAEHHAITIENIAKKLGSDGDNNDSFVLGAFNQDALIGMVGFARLAPEKRRHKAMIWGVYVREEWRGKGIARVLMSEVLARAKTVDGLEQILLSVGTKQNVARKLYQSFGFVVYGHEEHTLKVGDEYVDEELMALPVSR